MTGLAFEIDDSQLRAFLERLASAFAPSRMVSTLSDVAQAIQQRVALCFHDQREPWGNPWKQLSRVTLQKRRDQGRAGVSILRDTSQLFGSLSSSATGDEAAIHLGFEARPFQIHQFGGMAGRNRKVAIPARPALPIRQGGAVDLPPDWLDEVLLVMRTAVERAT